MKELRHFNSLFELLKVFSNEEKCIEYLEKVRWNGTVTSPFDPKSKVYKCSKGYYCKNTNKIFNVKTKTLFENTKVPLQKWFVGIWLITSHKKGISSLQLSKDLNITQKTGWFMLQRIRKCFENENQHKLFNTVEVDETYIGGKERNKNIKPNKKGTQGRSIKSKIPVIGMIERKGKIVSYVIENTKSETLTSSIQKVVDTSSKIYTDEWKGYCKIHTLYEHKFVKHNSNEFVDEDVYTNTIECFWGLLKRGLLGVYHRTSRKHLQMYIDEFVFRFNTREVKETERFSILLSNMTNRLRYKDLIDSLK